eukprot:1159467-Pelagomonas_calceolata.AAC.10
MGCMQTQRLTHHMSRPSLTRFQCAFDICSGDTMNTASRMETCCKPGCVHVSDAFAQLLPHEEWGSTGGVQHAAVCAGRMMLAAL